MRPTNLPTTEDSLPPDGSSAPRRVSRPLPHFLQLIYDRRRRLCEGLALGALFGLCASELGSTEIVHVDLLQDIVVLPAVLGALLALSPARRLLHAAVCLVVAAVLFVGYTPVINTLLPTVEHTDALQRSPAVVVLSTALHRDGTLDAPGQQRALHSFLLMKQGWAGTIVLTRAVAHIGDESAAITNQMHALGLSFPVEAVGPVRDTHDEAVCVAGLARRHGWNRVILVTQPWHMRRARALFIKQGLNVICSPCTESRYDMSALSEPRGRLNAFRDWLHETIGHKVYSLRGWL